MIAIRPISTQTVAIMGAIMIGRAITRIAPTEIRQFLIVGFSVFVQFPPKFALSYRHRMDPYREHIFLASEPEARRHAMAGLISFIFALVRGIVRGIRSIHSVSEGLQNSSARVAPSVPSTASAGPVVRRTWGGGGGLRVFRGCGAGLWLGFAPFVILLLYPALALAQPDLQIAGKIFSA